MSSSYFFATRGDLLKLLADFERGENFVYYSRGRYRGTEGIVGYTPGATIPMLGQASAEVSASCTGYLILSAGKLPVSRSVEGAEEGHYFIDQLLNPESLVFVPAGQWRENFILRGSIGTAHKNSVGEWMLRRFRNALRRSFENIHATYVGAEASGLLGEGKARLTSSALSDSTYDLVR